MRTASKTIANLKKAKRAVTDSNRAAIRAADADARSLVAARFSPARGTSGHVLLASTGIRNTGDQAMLDAFAQGVSGPITIVVQPEATYDLSRLPSTATVVTLPGLFIGARAEHRTAMRQLGELIVAGESLSIIGADIIDGGYHRRIAAMLWSIARSSAELGKNTRVIGFSWRPGADRAISRIAAAATRMGVVAYVRDPQSAARALADGLTNVVPVADSVFTLAPPPAATDPAARRRALVNISGLIRSRVDLTKDYHSIVEWLLGHDYEVEILPHVDNPGGSDVEAAREVWQALDARTRDRVTLRTTLLSPPDVQQLAAESAIVITGRMHLSILAAIVGTPAIVISTQGKVEGLMELLRSPGWAIEPRSGMSRDILGILEAFDHSPETAKTRLLTALPKVRELAWENYNGLTAGDHNAPKSS